LLLRLRNERAGNQGRSYAGVMKPHHGRSPCVVG
jgi:hypothetical protein